MEICNQKLFPHPTLYICIIYSLRKYAMLIKTKYENISEIRCMLYKIYNTTNKKYITKCAIFSNAPSLRMNNPFKEIKNMHFNKTTQLKLCARKDLYTKSICIISSTRRSSAFIC